MVGKYRKTHHIPFTPFGHAEQLIRMGAKKSNGLI
jgi:hypothetical protein